jgi:hypothetical protein
MQSQPFAAASMQHALPHASAAVTEQVAILSQQYQLGVLTVQQYIAMSSTLLNQSSAPQLEHGSTATAQNAGAETGAETGAAAAPGPAPPMHDAFSECLGQEGLDPSLMAWGLDLELPNVDILEDLLDGLQGGAKYEYIDILIHRPNMLGYCGVDVGPGPKY